MLINLMVSDVAEVGERGRERKRDSSPYPYLESVDSIILSHPQVHVLHLYSITC